MAKYTLSPAHVLFSSSYMLSIVFLLGTSNFVFFWVLMELSSFFLMGVALGGSSMPSALSIFFILQSCTALSIFLGVVANLYFISLVALVLKLGLFPFHMWYPSVAIGLDSEVLGIASTIHKLPPFMVLSSFVSPMGLGPLEWLILGGSALASAILMLGSSSGVWILISSAPSSAAWLFLALYASPTFFLVYLAMYTCLFWTLLSAPVGSNSWYVLVLGSLGGLPPLPLFFLKISILAVILESAGLTLGLLSFLLASAGVLVAYIYTSFVVLTSSTTAAA